MTSRTSVFGLDLSVFDWVWFAPSAATFSTIRNLDRGGPLRRAYGVGGEPLAVTQADAAWADMLDVASACLARDTHVVIEHPLRSLAWGLQATASFMARWPAVISVSVHLCAYSGGPLRVRKPTRLLTSAPWATPLAASCTGDHGHFRLQVQGSSSLWQGRSLLARVVAEAYGTWSARAPTPSGPPGARL